MRLRFFGGIAIDGPGGGIVVRGRGQEALLFRLALDTGTTVRYRALAEDIWADDLPDDPRASLQSLASRLRRSLPAGVLEAAPGGYRLTLPREAVDLTEFQDLVAAARRATDPGVGAELARGALELWVGDPWTPNDAFDWIVSDLYEDRGHAERLLRLPRQATDRAEIPSGAEDGVAAELAVPSTDAAGTPSRTQGAAGAEVADAVPITGRAVAPRPEAGSVPAAISSLVGRRDELGLIAEQLRSSRLVTLLGPGGAGKTTLAQETARGRPGAIVIELAPAGPDEVWPAVAAAVGRSFRLNEASAQPVGSRERALEAMAGRSLLVVLDNCEHVSAEAADLALDLLRGVPGARLLATSREPLGLPGEAFVVLGPLPEADAIELFTRRVRAARGRAPDPADDQAVARIVRRLDGLPLALELAAARSRTLSIAEIDAGLDDRFALLASGPRAADPRHQTLRALIDWSWETLTELERSALLAAAVFPDGIGAADTAVVAQHTGTEAAAFDQLVDRSLLHRSAGRFRMLETVREYGLDRLRSEGRIGDLRGCQARAVVDLATPRDAQLRGPRVREGLAWFDANEENLGAAVRAAHDSPELRDIGVRLVRAAMWAWMMRERFEDLQAGIQAFSSSSDPLDSEPAIVVNALGLLLVAFTAGREASTNAEAGAQPADLEPRSAATGAAGADFDLRTAEIIAAAGRHSSELVAAVPPLLGAAARGLATRRPGDPWSQGFDLDMTGLGQAPLWTRAFLSVLRAAVAQNGGDVDVLGESSERALTLFRELRDVWGIAAASQLYSEWLMLSGRLHEALEVADMATDGLTGLSSLADVLQERTIGVQVLVRLGRIEEARARVADIRAAAEADGAEATLLIAHLVAAGVEIAVGDGEAALRQLDTAPTGDMVRAFDQFVAWKGALRARALVLAGRTEESANVLRDVLPIAQRTGDQPIMAESALAAASWLASSGRLAPARQALATSVRLRGRLDATEPTLARLVTLLGPPDAGQGDLDLSAVAAFLD